MEPCFVGRDGALWTAILQWLGDWVVPSRVIGGWEEEDDDEEGAVAAGAGARGAVLPGEEAADSQACGRRQGFPSSIR